MEGGIGGALTAPALAPLLLAGALVSAGVAGGYGLDKGLRKWGVEGDGSHYGMAAGAGAGIGAAIGSVVPGVGTAVGAGVGAAIGVGGYGIYKNWDKIKEGAETALNLVKGAFDAIKGLPWGDIAHYAKIAVEIAVPPFKIVEEVWKNKDEIIATIKDGYNAVRSAFTTVSSFVEDHKSDILKGIEMVVAITAPFIAVTAWAVEHKDDLQNGASALWSAITDPIGTAEGIWNDGKDALVGGAASMLATADALINTVVGGIQDAINWFDSYKGMIKDVINSLINFVVDGVKQAVQKAVDLIPEPLKKAWQITETAYNLGGDVAGAAGDAAGAAGDLFGKHAVGGFVSSDMQLVGEEGPELVRLPKGTIVEPASRTTQLLRQFATGTDVIAGLKRGMLDASSMGAAPSFGLTPLAAANMSRNAANHVEITVNIESGSSVDEKLISKLKSELLATVRQAMEEAD